MSTIADSGAVRPDPSETDTGECQVPAEVIAITTIRVGPIATVTVRPAGTGCILRAIGGRRIATSVHLQPPELGQLIAALTEIRAGLAVTA